MKFLFTTPLMSIVYKFKNKTCFVWSNFNFLEEEGLLSPKGQGSLQIGFVYLIKNIVI